MIRYEVERVVRRPPEEVFYEVLDATHWHEWVPGVLEAGWRTAGPARAGHRGYEVRELYGTRVESDLRLRAVHPPSRIELDFSSGRRASGSAVFTFDPDGVGTHVRASAEVTGVPRLLEPGARWLFRRLDEKTLRKLAERVDG